MSEGEQYEEDDFEEVEEDVQQEDEVDDAKASANQLESQKQSKNQESNTLDYNKINDQSFGQSKDQKKNEEIQNNNKILQDEEEEEEQEEQNLVADDLSQDQEQQTSLVNDDNQQIDNQPEKKLSQVTEKDKDQDQEIVSEEKQGKNQNDEAQNQQDDEVQDQQGEAQNQQDDEVQDQQGEAQNQQDDQVKDENYEAQNQQDDQVKDENYEAQNQQDEAQDQQDEAQDQNDNDIPNQTLNENSLIKNSKYDGQEIEQDAQDNENENENENENDNEKENEKENENQNENENENENQNENENENQNENENENQQAPNDNHSHAKNTDYLDNDQQENSQQSNEEQNAEQVQSEKNISRQSISPDAKKDQPLESSAITSHKTIVGFRYADGSFYRGQMEIVSEDKKQAPRLKPHGFGTLFYPNGAIKYEGDFRNGIYHGNGTLYSADRRVIQKGAFRKGQFYQGDPKPTDKRHFSQSPKHLLRYELRDLQYTNYVVVKNSPVVFLKRYLEQRQEEVFQKKRAHSVHSFSAQKQARRIKRDAATCKSFDSYNKACFISSRCFFAKRGRKTRQQKQQAILRSYYKSLQNNAPKAHHKSEFLMATVDLSSNIQATPNNSQNTVIKKRKKQNHYKEQIEKFTLPPSQLHTLFAKSARLFSTQRAEAIKNVSLNVEYHQATNQMAYNNRAVMYLMSNNLEAALQDIDRAIEINRHNAASKDERLYVNKAVILKKLDRVNDAIVELNTAVFMNPHNAQAYSVRSECLAQLGRIQEAARDFAVALDIQNVYANTKNSFFSVKIQGNQTQPHFEKGLMTQPMRDEKRHALEPFDTRYAQREFFETIDKTKLEEQNFLQELLAKKKFLSDQIEHKRVFLSDLVHLEELQTATGKKKQYQSLKDIERNQVKLSLKYLMHSDRIKQAKSGQYKRVVVQIQQLLEEKRKVQDRILKIQQKITLQKQQNLHDKTIRAHREFEQLKQYYAQNQKHLKHLEEKQKHVLETKQLQEQRELERQLYKEQNMKQLQLLEKQRLEQLQEKVDNSEHIEKVSVRVRSAFLKKFKRKHQQEITGIELSALSEDQEEESDKQKKPLNKESADVAQGLQLEDARTYMARIRSEAEKAKMNSSQQ